MTKDSGFFLIVAHFQRNQSAPNIQARQGEATPDVDNGMVIISQQNKFEQVSKDGNQMSLATGPCTLISNVQLERGHCTVRSNGNGHLGTTPSPHGNITFPQHIKGCVVWTRLSSKSFRIQISLQIHGYIHFPYALHNDLLYSYRTVLTKKKIFTICRSLKKFYSHCDNPLLSTVDLHQGNIKE